MSEQKKTLPKVIQDFIAGHDAQDALHEQAKEISSALYQAMHAGVVKSKNSELGIYVGNYSKTSETGGTVDIHIRKLSDSTEEQLVARLIFVQEYNDRNPSLKMMFQIQDKDLIEYCHYKSDVAADNVFDLFEFEVYATLQAAHGSVPKAFKPETPKRNPS